MKSDYDKKREKAARKLRHEKQALKEFAANKPVFEPMPAEWENQPLAQGYKLILKSIGEADGRAEGNDRVQRDRSA